MKEKQKPHLDQHWSLCKQCTSNARALPPSRFSEARLHQLPKVCRRCTSTAFCTLFSTLFCTLYCLCMLCLLCMLRSVSCCLHDNFIDSGQMVDHHSAATRKVYARCQIFRRKVFYLTITLNQEATTGRIKLQHIRRIPRVLLFKGFNLAACQCFFQVLRNGLRNLCSFPKPTICQALDNISCHICRKYSSAMKLQQVTCRQPRNHILGVTIGSNTISERFAHSCRANPGSSKGKAPDFRWLGIPWIIPILQVLQLQEQHREVRCHSASQAVTSESYSVNPGQSFQEWVNSSQHVASTLQHILMCLAGIRANTYIMFLVFFKYVCTACVREMYV